MIKKLFCVFVVLVFSTACSEYFKPSISSICEQHPELCAGLNSDGWCRAEKAEIIRHQYDNLNAISDSHIYDLLLFFEQYEQCIEKATHIRHIKYRDKEAERMQGYLTAQSAIQSYAKQTSQSSDPYLQFYHWSRFGDEQAKNRFLAQSNTFSEPDLLIKLASIQIKRDNDQALASLYKALNLYTDIDHVDPQVFRSLITANLDDDKVQSAYVWAYAYSEVNEEGEAAVLELSQGLGKEVNRGALESTAKQIVSALKKGQFNADRAGLWRIK